MSLFIRVGFNSGQDERNNAEMTNFNMELHAKTQHENNCQSKRVYLIVCQRITQVVGYSLMGEIVILPFSFVLDRLLYQFLVVKYTYFHFLHRVAGNFGAAHFIADHGKWNCWKGKCILAQSPCKFYIICFENENKILKVGRVKTNTKNGYVESFSLAQLNRTELNGNLLKIHPYIILMLLLSVAWPYWSHRMWLAHLGNVDSICCVEYS